MRNKPYRKGDRLIESVASGVLVLIKQPFRFARLTERGGRNITGLIGFFFIFLSFLVFTWGLLCFVHAGGLSRLARGQFALSVMKVFKLRLNFSELF
jgi:hypothetical protein